MPKWVIHEDLCKGCHICVGRCPVKVLGVSEQLSERGFHPAKMLDEEHCTSCAMCARSCPDIAIDVFRKAKGE